MLRAVRERRTWMNRHAACFAARGVRNSELFGVGLSVERTPLSIGPQVLLKPERVISADPMQEHPCIARFGYHLFLSRSWFAALTSFLVSISLEWPHPSAQRLKQSHTLCHRMTCLASEMNTEAEVRCCCSQGVAFPLKLAPAEMPPVHYLYSPRASNLTGKHSNLPPSTGPTDTGSAQHDGVLHRTTCGMKRTSAKLWPPSYELRTRKTKKV